MLHTCGEDGVQEADDGQRAADRRGGLPGVRAADGRSAAEGEEPDDQGGTAAGERCEEQAETDPAGRGELRGEGHGDRAELRGDGTDTGADRQRSEQLLREDPEEAEGESDDDVFSWLDDKESVEEIEAALRNAGREDEITTFRKSIQGRFGNAAFVAEAALADGQVLEAEELFKKSLEHDPTSTTTQARLRGFALAHGNLLEAAAYDAESFFDNPTVAKYDQLMAICTVIGLADVVRKEVFRALETGVRPDFTETKTADWPLPLVASRRSLVEEPQPDFDLLSELLWREHCPADALSFYKQAAEQRKRTGELRVYGTNRQVWDVDWLMADRIAPIWPDEAIAIWERIIQDSPDSWQGDYDNIVRALRNMKPILFAAGKAKEFRARVHGLIDGNKRRRNLVEALEGVLSDEL